MLTHEDRRTAGRGKHVEAETRVYDLIERWERMHEQGTPVTIEALCAECPELIEDVRLRIDALRAMDPALDTGVTELLPTPEDPGSDGVGADHELPDVLRAAAVYRPQRRYARGGLGEVLTAHQEELDRTVALKRIRPDKLHETARLRFLREAAITARLQHPGIVPVYGIGQDDDGPFYTMPLIDGQTLKGAIDAFHRNDSLRRDPGRRTLEFRGLLQHFVSICNTVAYAHDRRIVHRDLKPSNIMLGPSGETLMMDWGLAKWLGEDDAVGEAEGDAPSPSPSPDDLTVTGAVLGTPQYMSPEQAKGEPVGPASDIFNLGLILHEILTGKSAFDESSFRGADPLRAVRTAAIVPPRNRDVSLSRALEATCLKALAARPEDRYASGRALADDLAKWMADEPVSAYREPRRTRLARWIRRHSTVSATATAVVLVAMGVLGIAYRRETRISRELAAAIRQTTEAEVDANRRLDETMKAIEEYYTGVSEEALRGGGISKELRERLLERPRQFYARLTSELASRPRPSERELELLARGRGNLGRILGTLSRLGEAQGEVEAAIAAFARLVAARPGVRAYQSGLANSHNVLGNMFKSTSQPAAAGAEYRGAIDVYARLVAAEPGNPEYQDGLAAGYNNLGTVLRAMARPAEAAASYKNAIDGLTRLVDANPGVLSYQHRLAWTYSNLGNTLVDTGRPHEAAEAHRKAIRFHARLVAAEPGNTRYQDGLAAAWINFGTALEDTGRLADAVEAYRNAIERYTQRVAVEPSVPALQVGQVMGHGNLGGVLFKMGRLSEADEALRRAIEISDRLVRNHPEVPYHQHALASGYASLSEVLRNMGRPAEAAGVARKAIDTYNRLVIARPDDAEFQSSLGEAWTNLGLALAAQGQHAEAVESYQQAIARQRPLFDRSPQIVRNHELLSGHYQGLAGSLRALKRVDEAADAARELVRLGAKDPARFYEAARNLASCVTIARDKSQKEAMAVEAVQTLTAAIAAGWSDARRTSRDPDLIALRERDDFRRLLAELFDRSFPVDPFVP
jgi:serine/threonine-protein kinase